MASLIMLLAIFGLYFTYQTPDGSRTFDMLTLLAATADKTIFPTACSISSSPACFWDFWLRCLHFLSIPGCRMPM